MMSNSIEDEIRAAETVDSGSLIAENESLRDRLLRAMAEAENVRRQAARRVAEANAYGISELSRALLTVVDNLQRTIDAAEAEQPNSAADDPIAEGAKATLREFLQTLERFGIRRIDAQGKPFDPNLHEAVMEMEDPSRLPGTITRVLQDGYTIHDRLLRPARVTVARQTAREEAPDDTDLGKEWASHSPDQE
jgi:molecular chaperone GrpE